MEKTKQNQANKKLNNIYSCFRYIFIIFTLLLIYFLFINFNLILNFFTETSMEINKLLIYNFLFVIAQLLEEITCMRALNIAFYNYICN